MTGPVAARTLGLDGDQVSDVEHHGGVDQAVYAFAREDLDSWVEWLGQPIRDGQFGENLTTSGIDVNAAEVGERWRDRDRGARGRLVRIPCNDFKNWMGLSGYDDTAVGQAVRRGGQARALPAGPGEGVLQAGDEIRVVHRPGHGVTVGTMFARADDPARAAAGAAEGRRAGRRGPRAAPRSTSRRWPDR